MSIKITKIEPIWLRVPHFDEACEWGEDAFIVKVHTDQGIVGVGESDSSPAVLQTIVNTPDSHSTCRGLAHVLIGENPLDISRLWKKMFDESSYMGRRGAVIHAISALDIALWDIASQYYEQPIHRLLGGAHRSKIRAYGTFIPSDDPQECALRAKSLVDKGFTALKFGGGNFGLDPDKDEAIVKAVRTEVGSDVGIALDLVYRWKNYRYALEQIERLSAYNLMWVEEPIYVDDHEGLRRLVRESCVPITGGEPLTTVHEFREFLTTNPDIVQPDITRAGGISELVKIAEEARTSSTRLVPHGFSTPILLSATAQFLAAQPDGDLIEYSQSTSPLFTDLVLNPLTLVDGCIEVQDCLGLGVDLNDDLIERYRVPEGR